MGAELYREVSGYLQAMPSILEWPELQALIARYAEAQPAHWMLPVISCNAVGGSEDCSIAAMGAIACMQISILLIDDMLDDDPRGEYHRLGYPSTANMASALQAGGIEAIVRARTGTQAEALAVRTLNRMVLSTTLGQHWDIMNPQDEESYWRVVRTKSSPFFGTCLELGAIMGGADEGIVSDLRRLGELYGELVQIQDDLNDTMESPANVDWLLGRSPLPILFAQTVSHPERRQFRELRAAVSDPQALELAQEIVIRSGAVSYCVDQLLQRYSEADLILAALPTAVKKEQLVQTFQAAMEPVNELMQLAQE